jgi:hypothetical protein
MIEHFKGKMVKMIVEKDGFFYPKPNQRDCVNSYAFQMKRFGIDMFTCRIAPNTTPSSSYKYGKNNALFIGDSYTFGSIVGDDETLPFYYEEISKRVTTNAGFSGYGIQHMIRRKKQLEKMFDFEKVFIMVIEDDFLREMVKPSNSMTYWLKQNIYEYAWVSDYLHNLRHVPVTRHYAGSFDELLKMNGKNVTFIFFEYFKTKFSYRARTWANNQNPRVSAITNVPEILQKNLEIDEYFSSDGHHPSPKVYKVLAEALA